MWSATHHIHFQVEFWTFLSDVGAPPPNPTFPIVFQSRLPTSTIFEHWVPLPAPGPPSTNTTCGFMIRGHWYNKLGTFCKALPSNRLIINRLGQPLTGWGPKWPNEQAGECVSVSAGRKSASQGSQATLLPVFSMKANGDSRRWWRSPKPRPHALASPPSRLFFSFFSFNAEVGWRPSPASPASAPLSPARRPAAGGKRCSLDRRRLWFAKSRGWNGGAHKPPGTVSALDTFLQPRCLHSWCTIHVSPRMGAHREENTKTAGRWRRRYPARS